MIDPKRFVEILRPIQEGDTVRFRVFEDTLMWSSELVGIVTKTTGEGMQIRSNGELYSVPAEQAKTSVSYENAFYSALKVLDLITSMDQMLGGQASPVQIFEGMKSEARKFVDLFPPEELRKAKMS